MAANHGPMEYVHSVPQISTLITKEYVVKLNHNARLSIDKQEFVKVAIKATKLLMESVYYQMLQPQKIKDVDNGKMVYVPNVLKDGILEKTTFVILLMIIVDNGLKLEYVNYVIMVI